jgi:hypothetical protein
MSFAKGQEKKLDDQTAMIKQQNETIDVLRNDQTEMIKQQKDQMASAKEHSEKIDFESDFKAPNLPLSLRFKGSGCHCNSI